MLRYVLVAVLCLSSAVQAAPGYLGGSQLLPAHGGLLADHASLFAGHGLGLQHSAPAYAYGHASGLAYGHAGGLSYGHAGGLGYGPAPGLAYGAAPAITKLEAAPAISYGSPLSKYASAPLGLGYKSIAAAPAYSYAHSQALPLNYGHPGYGQFAYGHGPALSLAHSPALGYGHGAGLAHAW